MSCTLRIVRLDLDVLPFSNRTPFILLDVIRCLFLFFFVLFCCCCFVVVVVLFCCMCTEMPQVT